MIINRHLNKKTILHISNDLIGGVGSVINGLKKHMNSTTFIHMSITFKNLSPMSKYKVLQALREFTYLKHVLKAKKKDISLFHFHGAWSPHILLLNKRNRIPTLVSPHGAFNNIALKKSPLKKFLAKKLYMKKAYLSADCIHALSSKEVHDIQSYGIHNIPIALIPNAIDMTGKVSIDKQTQKDLSLLASNRKVILSLSRIHISKGIESLIDAFTMLVSQRDDVVLFVVGTGDIKHQNTLKQKIRFLGLANQVFLLGELLDDKKNAAYSIADIFILPSKNEAFPISILESFRQKTPVITTTETPFKEIKKIGCGWYVKPTVAELFLALKDGTNLSKKELSAKGEKGYSWVQKNYSYEVIGPKMEELYLWLIERDKTPDCIINPTVIQ